MTIATGTKLGPYEITGAIGAGGMGEVYRAHDPKLGRDVAIKVLPEAFARDAERMARFQREAKVLASLSHPNIATIYGLEDSGSTRALVMELVEGPTLANRIKAGPIPVDESVGIAKQIADALEYAHERGIIHRDLKPANVKVTNEDAVKVLDFGLAKALEGDPSSIDISTSPTISRMATQAGVLLGTAAYMSPEQAKAKSVDRRADIWAFGCVLFEMLTGKMAFGGEAVTDTLAAVIKSDPDWSQLPAATPPHIRVLLRRCLQKDPKQRLRDIGDARIALDEVLSGSAPSPALVAPLWRRVIPWTLFGVTAFALAIVAWAPWHIGMTSGPAQLLRYEIALPEKTSFGTQPVGMPLALSPDGRHLAFAAKEPDGPTQLWIRDLDSLAARPLPGTDGATSPFWSPDSRALAFQAGDKLEEVDISGGAPRVICGAGVLGGSWSSSGVIVYGTWGGMMTVSAAGGTPSLLIKRDVSRGSGVPALPSFLPGDRRFLYHVYGGPNAGIHLGSLDGGGGQSPSKPLVVGWPAAYAPTAGSGPGHILYLQADRTLMAQAFDASHGQLEGDPEPIAQGVNYFTVSASGVLAYVGGTAAAAQLTWFDRHGKILGTVGEPGMFQPLPKISPDGSAVVLARVDPGTGVTDLWLYSLARGTRSRLTFDGKNSSPVWSPDGTHIAFQSAREGVINVYQQAVNGIGQAEAFEKPSGASVVPLPLDWSRDGRFFIENVFSGTKASIWVLPLSPGKDRKPAFYLNEEFNVSEAKLSPDGQWIAYLSDETGRDEIFVQTFPKPGGKWQVSANGGTHPVWGRDGSELYFLGLGGRLMAVEVKGGSGGGFQAGTPTALFDPHIAAGVEGGLDVTKDGRFLIPSVAGQSQNPTTIVVNWPLLLKK